MSNSAAAVWVSTEKKGTRAVRISPSRSSQGA